MSEMIKVMFYKIYYSNMLIQYRIIHRNCQSLPGKKYDFLCLLMWIIQDLVNL
jgi:hypothetical protein